VTQVYCSVLELLRPRGKITATDFSAKHFVLSRSALPLRGFVLRCATYTCAKHLVNTGIVCRQYNVYDFALTAI